MSDFGYLPILAVTAYAMEGDKEKAIAAGCDGYLSKPISTRELPKVVAGMLTKGRERIIPGIM